jgi:hypothetical protein
MSVCKCHSLARFTMTAAEKKRCRTTCEGAAFVARVATAALNLIEYEAKCANHRTIAMLHIQALAADALNVIGGASCERCMAGAAGLEPATPSLEGSCSVPTELRPRNSDSTATRGAAEGDVHGTQGDPAAGAVSSLRETHVVASSFPTAIAFPLDGGHGAQGNPATGSTGVPHETPTVVSPTPIEQLKATARVLAQGLGHSIGPFHLVEVGDPMRTAACQVARCIEWISVRPGRAAGEIFGPIRRGATCVAPEQVHAGDSIARLEALAGRHVPQALGDSEDLGDVSDHHFRAGGGS